MTDYDLGFWLPWDYNACYCERAKRRLRDWITNRNVQGELFEVCACLWSGPDWTVGVRQDWAVALRKGWAYRSWKGAL